MASGRGSRTIPEAPFGRALERVLSVRREGLHRASCRVLRPEALGRRWPQAPLLGAPLDTNFATPQRGATAHVSSVIWGTASVAAREKVTERYGEHDSAHSHYSSILLAGTGALRFWQYYVWLYQLGLYQFWLYQCIQGFNFDNFLCI